MKVLEYSIYTLFGSMFLSLMAAFFGVLHDREWLFDLFVVVQSVSLFLAWISPTFIVVVDNYNMSKWLKLKAFLISILFPGIGSFISLVMMRREIEGKKET